MTAGARPSAEAAPATASALAALWRPAVESRVTIGPASGSRPLSSRVVDAGSLAVTRPSSAVAGPFAVENRSAIPFA